MKEYVVESDHVVVGVGDDANDDLAKNTKYETKFKELKAQCVDLNQSIADKDTEINSLNQQITDYKRQIEENAVSESNKQNEVIKKLTDDLKDANEKYAALESESNELKEANKALLEDKQRIEGENTSLSEELNKLKQEMEAIKADKMKLEETCKEFEALKSAQNATESEANERLKVLQTENGALVNEIGEIKDSMKKVKRETADELNESDEQMAKLKEVYRKSSFA